MFHEMVAEIGARVPGITNVFLAGTDGIVVNKLNEGDQDELLIVEATTLLNECNRMGGELGSGPLQSFSFSFAGFHLVLQRINEEYFLLGVLNHIRFSGKLRFLLKVKACECFVNVT